jgi:hypothetical protein
MKRFVVGAMVAAALAGCRTPADSSGIVDASPGVFATSRRAAPNFYPMGMLRSFTLADAVAHCRSLQKSMRVIEEKPTETPEGSNDYRRFDLTFACD